MRAGTGGAGWGGCVDIPWKGDGRRFSEGGMQQSTDAYATFPRGKSGGCLALCSFFFSFFFFFRGGERLTSKEVGFPKVQKAPVFFFSCRT